MPVLTAVENVELPLLRRPRGGRARRDGGRSTPSSSSGSPTGPRTCPTSCPAASASASPSPARSSTTRRSSGPTSRPAISTARTRHEIVGLMRRLNLERGLTFLIVTHDIARRPQHRPDRPHARRPGRRGATTGGAACTRASRCLRSTRFARRRRGASGCFERSVLPELREQAGLRGRRRAREPGRHGAAPDALGDRGGRRPHRRRFYDGALERFVTLFRAPPGRERLRGRLADLPDRMRSRVDVNEVFGIPAETLAVVLARRARRRRSRPLGVLALRNRDPPEARRPQRAARRPRPVAR